LKVIDSLISCKAAVKYWTMSGEDKTKLTDLKCATHEKVGVAQKLVIYFFFLATKNVQSNQLLSDLKKRRMSKPNKPNQKITGRTI